MRWLYIKSVKSRRSYFAIQIQENVVTLPMKTTPFVVNTLAIPKIERDMPIFNIYFFAIFKCF